MRPSLPTLVIALFASPAWAQAQISFQNFISPDGGYTGVTDVRISDGNRFAWQPDANYADRYASRIGGDGGAGTWNRTAASLIRFDLSGSSAAGTITDAGLVLSVSNASNTPIQVFTLLTDWVEGEATWLQRSNTLLWAAPGASGTGTDRSALTTSFTASSKGVAFIPLPDFLITDWLANGGASNNGVLLESPNMPDAFEYASTRASLVQRPMLQFVANGTLYQFRQGDSAYAGSTNTSIANGMDPRLANQNQSGLEVNGWPGGVYDPNRNHSSTLVRFDVTAIPRWAEIHDAQLALNGLYGRNTSPINAYAVAMNWSETEVTWYRRLGPGEVWSDGGAVIGVDTGLAVLGTIGTENDGGTTATMAFTSDGLVALTQWRDNENANHGLMLQDLQLAGAYLGAEEANTLTGPRLSVRYFEGKLECGNFSCPADGVTPCKVDLTLGAVNDASAPAGTPATVVVQASTGQVATATGAFADQVTVTVLAGSTTTLTWTGTRAPFDLTVQPQTPQWLGATCPLVPTVPLGMDGGGGGGGSGGSGGSGGAGGSGGSGGTGGMGGAGGGAKDPKPSVFSVGCGCGATGAEPMMLLLLLLRTSLRASRRTRA